MNIDVIATTTYITRVAEAAARCVNLRSTALFPARHTIRFYTGNFSGARDSHEPAFTCRHIGLGTNYLLSRITFSLCATIRSFFSDADIIAIPYSIYAPVLTFLLKPKKTVVLFFTSREMKSLKNTARSG